MSARDRQIVLPLRVPAGDVEGAFTEVLLDAAVEHAPAWAEGVVASGNSRTGEVRIVLTFVDCPQALARGWATELLERVREHVNITSDDAEIALA